MVVIRHFQRVPWAVVGHPTGEVHQKGEVLRGMMEDNGAAENLHSRELFRISG